MIVIGNYFDFKHVGPSVIQQCTNGDPDQKVVIGKDLKNGNFGLLIYNGAHYKELYLSRAAAQTMAELILFALENEDMFEIEDS